MCKTTHVACLVVDDQPSCAVDNYLVIYGSAWPF